MTPEAPEPIPAADATRTGLPPAVAAVLAYLGWWLTGLFFLVTEPTHPYVRFHAAQAVVVFGIVSFVTATLMAGAFALLIASDLAFQVLMLLSQAVLLIGLAAWPVCLWKAYRGEEWAVPGVKPWIERLTGR